MSAGDITTAIRQALASERAAASHEDKYENQMKSAGASMYAAFTLALRAAPEYQGRKLDEKAILRIYKSTAPRKWWDEALAAAKVTTKDGKADRDHAKRLLQWHVDPEGARARRAQHALSCVSSRKRVAAKRTAAARGSRETPKAPTTAEMREIAVSPALGAGYAADQVVSIEDLLGECSRLSSAAKKVEPLHRAEALEKLRVTAREIERYVP